MQHYTEDVLLSKPKPGAYQLKYKGMSYLPTSSPTAVGVLLFGLRPRGIRFQCNSNPQTFMHIAHQAAYILHLHANGDRVTQDGHRRIELADLHEWVNAAVALAPDENIAEAARKLINENLGPHAYAD